MAQIEVTLSLLQGPSKALVSSILTAGAAYVYTTSNPALCFVARQPYDTDVFEEFERNTGIKAAPGLAHIYKPRRPVGVVALKRLVTVNNLGLTVSRNVAISLLLAVNRYIGQLQEAEERALEDDTDAEYPEFPWDEMKRHGYKGCINASIDWCTQFTRCVLDWLATKNLSLHLSNKLRKELKASVSRKAEQYAFLVRGIRVFKTSIYSEATFHAADWLVACCVEFYNIHTLPLKKSPNRYRIWLTRCGLHGIRCALVLAAVSIGNGVGSMASPSSAKTRHIFMFICSQGLSFMVNKHMHVHIAAAALPPPSSGPVVVDDDDDAQPPPVPPAAAVTPSEVLVQELEPVDIAAVLPNDDDNANAVEEEGEPEEPPAPAPVDRGTGPVGLGGSLPLRGQATRRRRVGGGQTASASTPPETPSAPERRNVFEDTAGSSSSRQEETSPGTPQQPQTPQ